MCFLFETRMFVKCFMCWLVTCFLAAKFNVFDVFVGWLLFVDSLMCVCSCLIAFLHHHVTVLPRLLKFNSSPLKSYLSKRKGSFSNHHFSGAMLNFGGVDLLKLGQQMLPNTWKNCEAVSSIRDVLMTQMEVTNNTPEKVTNK